MQDNRNILLATILSAIVLICWVWFYEKPKTDKIRIEKYHQEQQLKEQQSSIDSAFDLKREQKNNQNSNQNLTANLATREQILSQSQDQRIKISSGELHGSISLKGARFDDLTLANYHQTIDKNSPEVILLAPAQSSQRYFADFGWVSSDNKLELPNADTIWKSNNYHLTPQNPVILSWNNAQNIDFIITISLDENYMFSIEQSVENNSNQEIDLAIYGRINRVLENVSKSNYILHEGPIGVFDSILHEINYNDLIEENQQNFTGQNGWLGITDKYWLIALIPDKNLSLNARFSYQQNNNYGNIYNSEFISKSLQIAPKTQIKFSAHFFAGAKKVALLDEYSEKYDIDLFDRAVDFGWYYFLTKPFFFILKFLNQFLGNYGLAILAMTILVKLLMFPLANKSYRAMGKIKNLQPKIDEIRQNNKDSKMVMNKEIMELYKREKVNPASGCLPMLIQIPVFFSLYKVLYVTIDMRHAPFYGWIKDLSAPDPTSIFNLFGLLPFTTHGIITIGIWPILMGITMIIQQKLGPQISDPAQAKVMKILPFILIFVFASFPAGLLIYWTWSNILSVLQQWIMIRKIKN